MVVVDATIMMLLFRPEVAAASGEVQGITLVKERIEHLVDQLEKAGEKIIIPTPVLSEILVRAGPAASQRIVEEINKQSVFRLESFDARAAIEVAAMTRGALNETGKKRGKSTAPWAKIKFDRQIVAIAKVVRAKAIYSDDRDIKAIAKEANIPVFGLTDLPVPEEKRQTELTFEASKQVESASDATDED